MTTEERKQLFNEFSNCKMLKVTADGKVTCNGKIAIDYVSFNKDGDVFVEWRYNCCYEKPHTAEVNMVSSSYDDYIEGVFTDENVAKEVAEEWFSQRKAEKIAELEAELKRLRGS